MKPLVLSKPYTSGSETFSTITFREPAYQDYRQIGPVYDVQRGIVLRDREAIFSYVDRLVTSPAVGALAVLNVEDTMALEDHVLDFFVQARKSRAARESSFSGSAGTPAMSTG